MKRVFVVHCWDGSSEDGWYPWVKEELENHGSKVFVLNMPNTDEPRIDEWVPFLSNKVGAADEDTYFIGHSIGCQTIIRYLETLNSDTKVGGCVFAAGWFNLTDEATKDEGAYDIAEPWLKVPINFNKVMSHTNKFSALFSDNDPFVPLNDSNIFKEKLGAKIIVEHQKGHFTEEDGIVKLPAVVDELLSF